MELRGLILEDFVNYKEPAMFLAFPYCSFKCGREICQNRTSADLPIINVDVEDLIRDFGRNSITKAVILSGLEPLDSLDDVLLFLHKFGQEHASSKVVIYTGYTEEESSHMIGLCLKYHPNLVVKYGRYLPGHKPHHDEVLGVMLASDNQKAIDYGSKK